MSIGFTLGIPQMIIRILYITNLGIYAIQHGEPREGNYNFWAGLVATGINVALLKWGGFF
jgi:hypothetical protein